MLWPKNSFGVVTFWAAADGAVAVSTATAANAARPAANARDGRRGANRSMRKTPMVEGSGRRDDMVADAPDDVH
jgi:hypothetical protein